MVADRDDFWNNLDIVLWEIKKIKNEYDFKMKIIFEDLFKIFQTLINRGDEELIKKFFFEISVYSVILVGEMLNELETKCPSTYEYIISMIKSKEY